MTCSMVVGLSLFYRSYPLKAGLHRFIEHLYQFAAFKFQSAHWQVFSCFWVAGVRSGDGNCAAVC